MWGANKYRHRTFASITGLAWSLSVPQGKSEDLRDHFELDAIHCPILFMKPHDTGAQCCLSPRLLVDGQDDCFPT